MSSAVTTEPPVDRELEASLEAFFRNQIRMCGGMAIKLAPTEAGLPDRIAIFPGGHIYLVELKTVDGELSAIQRYKHRKLQDQGIPVAVLEGRRAIARWVTDTNSSHR